jgi:NTE family protein
LTWGVLDALLADPRIHFERLSGHSDEALIAVVRADFWPAAGRRRPAGRVSRGEIDDSALSPATRLLAHRVDHFAPAQLNLFDLNPLRSLLVAGIGLPAPAAPQHRDRRPGLLGRLIGQRRRVSAVPRT